MSVIIIPGGKGAGNAIGRLASTLLSVTVAGMSDPSRFRRGKAYVGERAVTRLEIDEGTLKASVMGSRANAYQVVVTVEVVPRPEGLDGSVPEREHITRLAPQPSELLVSCTCPDWDDPCKHAVAALLAFADELSDRPELLVHWRCSSGPVAARAEVGSRARGDRHLRLVPEVPASPWQSEAWKAFEGVGLDPPSWPALLTSAASIGSATLERVDVGAVVRSALAALRPDT